MADFRIVDVSTILSKWHDLLKDRWPNFPCQTFTMFMHNNSQELVRCKECKNGAPLPEEARTEFSPGVMRCLAGRGDCDRYCTTWEDGFCDEGAKKDGGAEQ